MKKLLFCLVVLSLLYQDAFAQRCTVRIGGGDVYFVIMENYRDTIPVIHEWLWDSSRILTHDMRLGFQVPEGFKEKGDTEHFEGNRLLARTFRNLAHRLQSDDNEMISFLGIWDISTSSVDKQHHYQMRAYYNVFHHYLQHIRKLVANPPRWFPRNDTRSSGFYVDWRESAHFFLPEETRAKFNADTAAFFTLTLPPEYYFEGRFRYIDVFLLQKNGRGYVYVVSFFTEKAKRNIDWYRRRLWGSLSYED